MFISKHKNIITLLFTALLLRILLSFWGSFEIDHNTFIAWGRSLNTVGISQFYSNGWSDYLPGYLYALKLLASIETYSIIPNILLYKLPAILGDLLIGIIFYNMARKKLSHKKSLIATSLVLFNPAIFANSTLWGQVDILSALFSVGAIFFLNNIYLSSLLLAIGGSIKPQAAMTLPIIFALIMNESWEIKKTFKYFSFLTMFFLLIFLPFSNKQNLIAFILERVSVTLNQYPYGSVNAFNFWGLWGFWQPDNLGLINPKIIGNIILLISSIFSFFAVYKKPKNKYLGLAFLFLVNFLFLTRMHERHMLPTLIPLAISALYINFAWIIYVLLSISYVANLFYAYQTVVIGSSFFTPFLINIFIVINLSSFAALAAIFLFNKNIEFDLLNYKKILKILNKSSKSKKFEKDLISKKLSKKILYTILLFALATRIFNLGYPAKDYFDEIYHGFTARQILAGDPKPWHWSSAHPEGFAYEWTHPPFGKEIMAASMAVFGVNYFSMRLPGALLGVGIIFLTYLIALELTKRNDISLIAASILSLDGLTLSMSRIATVDVYFVFFSLLTLYFLLKEKYLHSSFALGFSLASKWSTAWLLPILLVGFISQKLKFKKSIIFFFIVPPLIYVASYLPMFGFGHNFETFIGMQKQMWWYHSGLDATHPYTSRWWSWIFNIRPVYLYQFDNGQGIMGNIYAMGNPFFFWFGFIAFLIVFYLLIRRKIPKAIGFVLFSYLAFFVPWSASPRIMFIYHYMPSLPFLAILLAVVLRRYPKLIKPALIILFVSFVYFYPHWTGLHIPDWLSGSYYWLKSWR